MDLTKTLITLLWASSLALLLGCKGGEAKIGEPAPPFILQDVSGKTHTLSDYQGQQLTMIHFWTDWCDACRKEFPKIERYYRELHPEGLEILAVNVGQAKTVSEAFQQEFNITFPMLVDENQTLAIPYNIEVFPTNFLLDRNGKVVREIRGWADKTTVESILQSIRANQ